MNAEFHGIIFSKTELQAVNNKYHVMHDSYTPLFLLLLKTYSKNASTHFSSDDLKLEMCANGLWHSHSHQFIPIPMMPLRFNSHSCPISRIYSHSRLNNERHLAYHWIIKRRYMLKMHKFNCLSFKLSTQNLVLSVSYCVQHTICQRHILHSHRVDRSMGILAHVKNKPFPLSCTLPMPIFGIFVFPFPWETHSHAHLYL